MRLVEKSFSFLFVNKTAKNSLGDTIVAVDKDAPPEMPIPKVVFLTKEKTPPEPLTLDPPWILEVHQIPRFSC